MFSFPHHHKIHLLVISIASVIKMVVSLTAKNLFTGKSARMNHHCSECGRATSDNCLKKLHISACEVCGHVFHVKSKGGCGKHKYNQGYNLTVVQERRGIDPNFKEAVEDKLETEAGIDEDPAPEKPYDTDWKKLEFKDKNPPKEKVKKGGKKQPTVEDYKTLMKNRRTGAKSRR